MKKLCLILAGALMISMLSGCRIRSIEDDFISDGDFKYYYIEDRDCYAIADLTEQGNEKQELYMPPYFKGKEVKYTSFYRSSLVGLYEHTFSAPNAEKVFFSYLSDYYDSGLTLGVGFAKKFFLINNEEHYIRNYWRNFHDYRIFFISGKAYETYKRYLLDKNEYQNSNSAIMKSLFVANTSYMFNYEGSPNEGYFFINDFERGGEIEDTPYKPTREGYTFGGWYKEPECKNAWDFGADTLPEAEYDGEGVLIFRETQLYAKWIKN